MEGEVSVDMGDIVVERRARFGQAYVQLRQAHPLLPEQLRLFQVSQYTCVLKKTFVSIFRSTLLPLPYMALMVISLAVCPQGMARPCQC